MTEPTSIDEAEILKRVAEAKQAEAAAKESEANALLAMRDVELRDAEIRRTLAEAVKEEQEAVIAGIARAERERFEELAKVSDHYVFTHYFDGPVDEKSVYTCLNTLNAWDRLHPDCDMNIIINSPGGSAIDGLHLFDDIYAYSTRGGGNHKVTIKVRGMAASMAGILLQAADERVMGKNAWVLIHEVSSGAIGKIGDLKDEVRFLERMCDRIADIFVERSNGRIARDEFEKKWSRHDWWLSSEEMMQYGFIDRIG